VALQYGIRTYVDEMDDGVMTAYAAWPERLYLVDQDGRVRYAGGLGPSGFKPAELKEAVETQLAELGPGANQLWEQLGYSTRLESTRDMNDPAQA
jgi:hypothetical protein